MAQINATVQWDTRLAIAWLQGIRKQGDFAMARALTTVAREGKTALAGASKQFLDRPTPFVQNAWRYEKATKQSLTALLYPEQHKREPYLRANIYGGTRGVKPMEAKFRSLGLGSTAAKQFFPTKFQPRNTQGNVTRGVIGKLINSAERKETGKGSVFVGKPANSTKPYGIYRRMGGRQPRLRPLFIAATRPMPYDPIFPVGDVVGKIVERRLQSYFAQYLEQAIATAR